jgi:hypothetical protein
MLLFVHHRVLLCSRNMLRLKAGRQEKERLSRALLNTHPAFANKGTSPVLRLVEQVIEVPRRRRFII